MISLGLIGYPLDHSLSPVMHSAGLKAAGINGEYRLYPIPPLPEGKAGLSALLKQVRDRGVNGLNVTIPHKQTVLPFLDELTPLAGSIEAVNTIFLRAGRIVGDNTDAPGFMADLNRLVKRQSHGSLDLSLSNGNHALILGTGGSARAVAFVLCEESWKVTMAGRKFKELNSMMIGNHQVDAVPYTHSAIIGIDARVHLVVNATPLGMWPAVENDPWPEKAPLPNGAMVYDLVYNPPETALIRRAMAHGLSAHNGLGMLVEQAAFSLERWTGRVISRQVMREAIEK